ncbi:SNF1-RELATED PROTEIN KINASE 3.8, CBL-INTERACTING PROTEIN KINASE 10, SOS3-interacting protein 1 [Hibiscus trionum]|uniref:non-specific serine/threonine protein kinase n=1 Tax=Hibiscus trionum TaxID=183268 RepID=A0A9W7IMS1_HIBTR|nr:SNF1-RELATED PROTEIN KINASE 3.8, CBL-INTERACTING PROTEIN KINASE 10, SOS3-interacting protein 1 [Hibiscus trionum]
MENKPSVLTRRYEIGRLLGQGTFAKVYYARSIQTSQSVAIKVIDKEKVTKVGTINQIKREISVMRIARHPNIVQLYEVMATKTKIFFVMEYCKGGELFDKIANGRLKVDVARKYFIQLINAVDFCHSRGVYHRDIKPENLLLDENENLKVTDFGLSALAESKRQDGLLHTTCGTPAYVAPEVINRKGYDGVAADIWSCGVVLYVLLAGYLPFHDSNLMEMYRKIGRAEFRFPSWFPLEVRRLVSKMLDPNPTSRISMSKIRGSGWFKKGLNAELKKPEASQDSGNSNDNAETRQEQIQLPNLNAFDIISLSDGFDLSGLFEGISEKRETRFSSKQPASVIISKLEEAARLLRLKVKKKDGGVWKIERLKEGRKGILSIDAEIFQVTPTFHLVEIKKSNGDTLEYQKIVKEDMRPALQDIVWVWQGDQQQQQGLQHEEQQEQPQQRNDSSSASSSSSYDKPC